MNRRHGLTAWTLTLLTVSTVPGRDAEATPPDALTFRPTVLVRKGDARGSGTVIASAAGESLILTAAHVVRGPGPLQVELHRYNLGLERVASREPWPRLVAGEVAATDPAADLAIVRVRRQNTPLPYVARLASEDEELTRASVLTSVGIDEGTHLSSWRTRVRGVAWLVLDEPEKSERPFFLTVQPPRQGRSGGGLFLETGALAGVCIGRTRLDRRGEAGVFAATASIRRLLRDHELETAVARTPPAPAQSTEALPKPGPATNNTVPGRARIGAPSTFTAAPKRDPRHSPRSTDP